MDTYQKSEVDQNMKEKLIRFMQGRYGTDTLSQFLLICGLVVVLFSSFSSSDTVRMIWYVVGWALIIYCYYRMFSRNVTKRYAENQAFLARTYTQLFQTAVGIDETKTDLPYLYLPRMQAEDPDPAGKRKDRSPVSEMWSHLCEKELIILKKSDN